MRSVVPVVTAAVGSAHGYSGPPSRLPRWRRETGCARWGGITDASEHALALEAILKAVADAGLTVDDVDGLTSFADDRNDAAFLAADLGLPERRCANMVWMPGGGGGWAVVANAALAVESGKPRGRS